MDNLARLAGASAQDLTRVLHAPELVPAEVKYAIAIRTSYLITVIDAARGG
ncbi:HTH domain-containing protein [Microbacterium mangrovi]|uniref:HTH domain-containing protein n=1 Tax=Microbacterium mangrovi TaxID=1348253 RepID=UPI000A9C91C8|nr:HTH domain-containing protein [Microbacterium mangrovi]